MKHFKVIISANGSIPNTDWLIRKMNDQFDKYSFYFSNKHSCFIVNSPGKPEDIPAYGITFEEITIANKGK